MDEEELENIHKKVTFIVSNKLSPKLINMIIDNEINKYSQFPNNEDYIDAWKDMRDSLIEASIKSRLESNSSAFQAGEDVRLNKTRLH